jgi:hypothetical protein
MKKNFSVRNIYHIGKPGLGEAAPVVRPENRNIKKKILHYKNCYVCFHFFAFLSFLPLRFHNPHTYIYNKYTHIHKYTPTHTPLSPSEAADLDIFSLLGSVCFSCHAHGGTFGWVSTMDRCCSYCVIQIITKKGIRHPLFLWKREREKKKSKKIKKYVHTHKLSTYTNT